jgi:hypothetical protein
MRLPFDSFRLCSGRLDGMALLKCERPERIFARWAAPDTRPLNASAISAANRRHDEMLGHGPWFRLWQESGLLPR